MFPCMWTLEKHDQDAFGSRLASGTGPDLWFWLGPGPFWIGFNVFQTKAPPSWLCAEFLAHSPNILTGIQYCYCAVPLSEGFSTVMQHQHGLTGFKKNPRDRFFAGHVLGRAFVKSVSQSKEINLKALLCNSHHFSRAKSHISDHMYWHRPSA